MTPIPDNEIALRYRRFLAVQRRQAQEARCRGIARRMFNLRPCLLTHEQNFWVVCEERTPNLRMDPAAPPDTPWETP